MESRTEEQKVTQTGITVLLGGKDYEIRPLVMRYSREWRKSSLPIIAYLLHYKNLSGEESEKAFVELFSTKADEIIDSFFEYARDLNREEIENIATDGDIILAFLEVFNSYVAPLSVRTMKQEGEGLQSVQPSST